MMETHLSIPYEYKGQRLDVVLALLYPEFSRTQLSAALKKQHILINGAPGKPKDKVFGDETIFFKQPIAFQTNSEEVLPEAIPLTIAYEDDDLLIINKPAGLVVHPGAGNRLHTLVNALLFYLPSLAALPRAGIIHRLDKDTTGLLIVAKHPLSYQYLSQKMQAREIKRHYLTLVKGRILMANKLHTNYGRDPKNRLKMAVRKEGKQAVTYYQPITCFKHFTFLKVSLETGRTHQIRVHMAYLKHPIVGDPLYASSVVYPVKIAPPVHAALSQLPHQVLHAAEIELVHPFKNSVLCVQAPLPTYFHDFLTQLEIYDV